MLYAAMTFWLLVILFAAWGVHHLWLGLVRPKVVNAVLLPGTLVAQLGHIVGLLVTGGTVKDATLIRDDDEGEPLTQRDGRRQIPVLGPIVTAVLPLLACGLCLYLLAGTIGRQVMNALGPAQVSAVLPTTLTSFWDLLRGSVSVIENVSRAVSGSDFYRWQSWVFLYLVLCLTVRMAPLPGTQRGAVGAILLLGLISALLGVVFHPAQEAVHNLWVMLSFAVGSLLLLMLVSLAARGAVGLFRILVGTRPAAA